MLIIGIWDPCDVAFDVLHFFICYLISTTYITLCFSHIRCNITASSDITRLNRSDKYNRELQVQVSGNEVLLGVDILHYKYWPQSLNKGLNDELHESKKIMLWYQIIKPQFDLFFFCIFWKKRSLTCDPCHIFCMYRHLCDSDDIHLSSFSLSWWSQHGCNIKN